MCLISGLICNCVLFAGLAPSMVVARKMVNSLMCRSDADCVPLLLCPFVISPIFPSYVFQCPTQAPPQFLNYEQSTKCNSNDDCASQVVCIDGAAPICVSGECQCPPPVPVPHHV